MSRWSNSYERAVKLIDLYKIKLHEFNILYIFSHFRDVYLLINFLYSISWKLFACSIIWYRGTCIKMYLILQKFHAVNLITETQEETLTFISLQNVLLIFCFYFFIYNNTYHMTIFILVLRNTLQKTDSRAVLSKIN